jgi:hypothetical protein
LIVRMIEEHVLSRSRVVELGALLLLEIAGVILAPGVVDEYDYWFFF